MMMVVVIIILEPTGGAMMSCMFCLYALSSNTEIVVATAAFCLLLRPCLVISAENLAWFAVREKAEKREY